MVPPTQTLNLDVEAISGICGSVSIACWVVVFSPQIIQNFQRGSADALSIQFLVVWLLGDVFNIVGAILQGVLPTMIILAFYYTLADIVLILQCFYYRGFTWRDNPAPAASKPNAIGEPNERTQLLFNNNQHGPAAHERRGSDWSALSPAVPHFADTPPPAPPTAIQTVVWNTVVILTVVAAGVVGWFLGQQATTGKEPPAQGKDGSLEFSVWGQFFGWLCAISYIASRLPQLYLNYRRKTTDGLSMLFFLFACLGNLTYILSIVAYEPHCRHKHCKDGEAAAIYGRYLLINLSWIAGASVTLFLDIGIFIQYFIYNKDNPDSPDSPSDQRSAVEPGSERRSTEEDWNQRPLLARDDSGYS